MFPDVLRVRSLHDCITETGSELTMLDHFCQSSDISKKKLGIQLFSVI